MKKLIFGLIALALAWGIGVFHSGNGTLNWIPIEQAHAIIGRPFTPISYAGVARRTTRRMIYRTSVYVATLPAACTVVVVEGSSLHYCGGTYYQAYGSQYVVVNVQ